MNKCKINYCYKIQNSKIKIQRLEIKNQEIQEIQKSRNAKKSKI